MSKYATTIKGGSCYANSASAHIIAGILVGIIGVRRINVEPRGYGHDPDWVIEAYCSAEEYREFVDKMDRIYIDNFHLNHELIRFDRVEQEADSMKHGAIDHKRVIQYLSEKYGISSDRTKPAADKES